MTNNLEQFLKKHIDLIQEEDFEKLVLFCSVYSPYWEELMLLLQEVGIFQTFDQTFENFCTKFKEINTSIEEKYGVTGLLMDIAPAISMKGQDNYISRIISNKTVHIRTVALPKGNKFLPEYAYTYKEVVDFTGFSIRYSLIDKDDTQSLMYVAIPPKFNINIFDIMDDNRIKRSLKEWSETYEKFCEEFLNGAKSCVDSFDQIYETRTQLIPYITGRLEEEAKPILGKIFPKVSRRDDSFVIDTGIDNSRNKPIEIVVPIHNPPRLHRSRRHY